METDDIEGRFKFHPPPSDARRQAHEQIRGACKTTAHFLNGLLPEGREKSLAITHMEEAMFWANAALARQEEDTA